MGIFDFFFRRQKTEQTLSHVQPVAKNFIPSDNDIEVLMRIKKYNPECPPQGIINCFCNNIPLLAQKFIDYGFLELPTTEERLNFLTIPQLKTILKNHSFPVSGKKADLIERIMLNIPMNDLNLDTNSNIYHISLKGNQLIEQYKDKKENAERVFNNDCIDLILQGNFTKAYYNICTNYASSPLPHGLGIDWSKEAERGIPEDNRDILHEYLKFQDIETHSLLGENVNVFNACVILCELKGESSKKAIGFYKNYTDAIINTEDSQALSLYAHYLLSIINSLYELNSYREDDIKKFDVLCCSDSCEICKKASKNAHSCKTAKIGKTLPPFHKGCRCTTAAHF